MIRRLVAVAAAAALAALTGCGGGAHTATTSITSSPTLTATSASGQRIPAGTIAEVLDPASTVAVHTTPAGKALTKLAGRTQYKTALTLPVQDRQSGWLHVTVPVRPNGTTGWVETKNFRLKTIQDASITVDLSDRKITIVVDGKPHTGPVAVGSPENPTPTTGSLRAFVTDNLKPDPPTGPYGAVALGVSVFSMTLTEFAGGPGQIGIHGTSDQTSVGKPVSHGCIRVGEALEPVLAKVPVGALVTITD